ncbi:hypothetical protein [Streptomyces sp. SID13726]|uniref:hypothetical protein n=1 Tax=Streptomyces sp. SID13726 TaxID=2706058 RepID=UPI0013BE1A81|nr:hypothetical protein [Streptomyces sp. SID13726]NEB00845.1 hypothetical protein [Streptomyces sp. SID13726]
MDERSDPVQIIAGVGTGFSAEHPERAIQVWMHLAATAGWDVSRVDGASIDLDAGERGLVDVEGLRYVVRRGRRVRRTLYDDSDGTLAQRPIFGFAAWAEPVLSADSIIP